MGIKCRLTRLGNANNGYAVKWQSKIWCGFAAMPRLFQRLPGNSRFAVFLPDSKDIQRVEIAESSVKRAFRGVCPPPDQSRYKQQQKAFKRQAPHFHSFIKRFITRM